MFTCSLYKTPPWGHLLWQQQKEEEVALMPSAPPAFLQLQLPGALLPLHITWADLPTTASGLCFQIRCLSPPISPGHWRPLQQSPIGSCLLELSSEPRSESFSTSLFPWSSWFPISCCLPGFAFYMSKWDHQAHEWFLHKATGCLSITLWNNCCFLFKFILDYPGGSSI